MKTQSEDFSTRFIVELIKPSHYDDDGYVIQWWRGFVPSNSLSAIYGLVSDARDRRALGTQVNIDIEAHDETTSKINSTAIIRRFKRNQVAYFGLGFASALALCHISLAP